MSVVSQECMRCCFCRYCDAKFSVPPLQKFYSRGSSDAIITSVIITSVSADAVTHHHGSASSVINHHQFIF